jgi:two-component system response regulator AgrA
MTETWRQNLMHYFIILDDDNSHNNFMEKNLEGIIEKRNLEAAIALNTTNPKEVLEYSMKYKARNNIYLLDVYVKDKTTGIDVASIIRSQEAGAYILFISAHPECVMPSLKTKIFDYLIKPISIKILEDCILAIMKDYRMLNNNYNVQTLSIKSGFKIYNIPLDEIVYFEKFGHVLVVHTILGRVEGTESLESIEQKLDISNFYRCHKSYIVNLNYITRIDYPNNTIYLKNGEECQVSKRNRRELKLLCCHI